MTCLKYFSVIGHCYACKKQGMDDLRNLIIGLYDRQSKFSIPLHVWSWYVRLRVWWIHVMLFYLYLEDEADEHYLGLVYVVVLLGLHGVYWPKPSIVCWNLIRCWFQNLPLGVTNICNVTYMLRCVVYGFHVILILIIFITGSVVHSRGWCALVA